MPDPTRHSRPSRAAGQPDWPGRSNAGGDGRGSAGGAGTPGSAGSAGAGEGGSAEGAAARVTWYAVSEDGGSSVRITSGLRIGETESGALALNDPDTQLQWLKFLLDETGRPTLSVIDAEWILCDPEGNRLTEQRLRAGDVVVLPGHALRVSRSIEAPPGRGRRIEVLPVTATRPLAPTPDPGAPTVVVGPIREVEQPAVPAEPRTGRERGAGAAASGPRQASAEDDVTLEMSAAVHSRHGPPRQDDPLPPAPSAPPADDDATRIWTARPGPAVSTRDPGQPRTRGESRSHSRARSPGHRLVRLGRTALALALLVPAALAVMLLVMEGRPGVSERTLEILTPPAPSAPGGETADTRAPADPSPQGLPARPAPGEAQVAETPAAETPAAEAPATEALAAEPDAASAALADRPEAVTTTEPAARAAPAAPPEAPRTVAPEAETTPASKPAPTPAPPAVDLRIAGELARAEQLLDEGFITFPPQGNAVAVLSTLLERHPGNAPALALLGECTNRLIDSAIEARSRGLEFEARNTLEEVFGFNPDHPVANALWQEWTGAPR